MKNYQWIPFIISCFFGFLGYGQINKPTRELEIEYDSANESYYLDEQNGIWNVKVQREQIVIKNRDTTLNLIDSTVIDYPKNYICKKYYIQDNVLSAWFILGNKYLVISSNLLNKQTKTLKGEVDEEFYVIKVFIRDKSALIVYTNKWGTKYESIIHEFSNDMPNSIHHGKGIFNYVETKTDRYILKQSCTQSIGGIRRCNYQLRKLNNDGHLVSEIELNTDEGQIRKIWFLEEENDLVFYGLTYRGARKRKTYWGVLTGRLSNDLITSRVDTITDFDSFFNHYNGLKTRAKRLEERDKLKRKGKVFDFDYLYTPVFQKPIIHNDTVYVAIDFARTLTESRQKSGIHDDDDDYEQVIVGYRFNHSVCVLYKDNVIIKECFFNQEVGAWNSLSGALFLNESIAKKPELSSLTPASKLYVDENKVGIFCYQDGYLTNLILNRETEGQNYYHIYDRHPNLKLRDNILSEKLNYWQNGRFILFSKKKSKRKRFINMRVFELKKERASDL